MPPAMKYVLYFSTLYSSVECLQEDNKMHVALQNIIQIVSKTLDPVNFKIKGVLSTSTVTSDTVTD